MTIKWCGETNMFKDWTYNACPVIPTNLTPYANAGIARTIRDYTPPNEFERQHRRHPNGGWLFFTNGKCAWDFPTKPNLNKGTDASIPLIHYNMQRMVMETQLLLSVGIDTILLPKLGAGLGRLAWQDVWDEISLSVCLLSKNFTVNIYAEETYERQRATV